MNGRMHGCEKVSSLDSSSTSSIPFESRPYLGGVFIFCVDLIFFYKIFTCFLMHAFESRPYLGVFNFRVDLIFF
jgi:hypothetical protein